MHGILSDSTIQDVKAFQPIRHFCMTLSKDLLSKLWKSSTGEPTGSLGSDMAKESSLANGSAEENQRATENDDEISSKVDCDFLSSTLSS